MQDWISPEEQAPGKRKAEQKSGRFVQKDKFKKKMCLKTMARGKSNLHRLRTTTKLN